MHEIPEADFDPNTIDLAANKTGEGGLIQENKAFGETQAEANAAYLDMQATTKARMAEADVIYKADMLQYDELLAQLVGREIGSTGTDSKETLLTDGKLTSSYDAAIKRMDELNTSREDSSKEDLANYKTCAKCGEKNLAEAKFCGGCGRNLSLPHASTEQKKDEKKYKVCAKCGGKNPEDARFCGHCGKVT